LGRFYFADNFSFIFCKNILETGLELSIPQFQLAENKK